MPASGCFWIAVIILALCGCILVFGLIMLYASGLRRDPAAVDAIFTKYQPTHVIHVRHLCRARDRARPTEFPMRLRNLSPAAQLAALVGGLFKNMRLKLTFLRDNLLINDNVLEGSHQAKVQKLVSCLSTCVFPDKVEYPLDETKVHRELPVMHREDGI